LRDKLIAWRIPSAALGLGKDDAVGVSCRWYGNRQVAMPPSLNRRIFLLSFLRFGAACNRVAIKHADAKRFSLLPERIDGEILPDEPIAMMPRPNSDSADLIVLNSRRWLIEDLDLMLTTRTLPGPLMIADRAHVSRSPMMIIYSGTTGKPKEQCTRMRVPGQSHRTCGAA